MSETVSSQCAPLQICDETRDIGAHVEDSGLISISDAADEVMFNMDEARALRDWLNKALPAEDHPAHQSAAEVQACPICSPPAVSAAAAHVHVWTKAPDSDLALCVCGDYSDDWYCSESPDHVCHYSNGNADQCDNCGLPEERK